MVVGVYHYCYYSDFCDRQSPSPAPPPVLSDEERLAAAIQASKATKEEDAARRRAETDALERAAAERFQTLEGEHQAEVARQQAAERAQAEAARAREEREAEQRAEAEAERRRQADVAAAAAAQEQAELQRVIDEEAHKYTKSLGEAGLAPIAPGPSLASDVKKAERYYDKVVSCHNIAGNRRPVAFSSSGLHSSQDGSDIVVDRTAGAWRTSTSTSYASRRWSRELCRSTRGGELPRRRRR